MKKIIKFFAFCLLSAVSSIAIMFMVGGCAGNDDVNDKHDGGISVDTNVDDKGKDENKPSDDLDDDDSGNDDETSDNTNDNENNLVRPIVLYLKRLKKLMIPSVL